MSAQEKQKAANGAELDPEEDTWDWEATDEMQQAMDDADKTAALFCGGEVCASPGLAAALTKERTGFDLAEVCRELGIYERIRLVNCARKLDELGASDEESVTKNIDDLMKMFSKPDGSALNDDALLQPVLENDSLLQYVASLPSEGNDEDEWTDDDDTAVEEPGKEEVPSAPTPVGIQSAEIALLRQQLRRAKELLHEYGVADELPESEGGPDNDSYYFDSYSHWGIHQEMLKDAVRTDAYRDAIEGNAAFFKGKSVLDVGCGTGILSMFAARAGAKRVVGVDMSQMAFKAMDNVKENGLEDVVTIIHGKIEDLSEKWLSRAEDNAERTGSREAKSGASSRLGAGEALQPGSFDIIISEWMGYALVFECMMETVLKARDVWLRKDGKGLVLPNTAEIYVQAMSDRKDWEAMVGYWEDVYGFKMNSMKSLVLPEAHVKIVDPESILGGRCLVRNFDCETVKPEHLDLKNASFELDLTATLHGTATANSKEMKKTETEEITAICISFDCHFRHKLLTQATPLPTGPECTPTHWKQTVLYLPSPIPRSSLPDKDKLTGLISISRNAQNPRNLDFALNLNTKGSNIEVTFKMG